MEYVMSEMRAQPEHARNVDHKDEQDDDVTSRRTFRNAYPLDIYSVRLYLLCSGSISFVANITKFPLPFASERNTC